MAAPSPSARSLRLIIAATCLFPVAAACGRSDVDDYLYGEEGTVTFGGSSNEGGNGARAGTRNGGGGAASVAGAPNGVGATSAAGGNLGSAGEPATGGIGIAGTISVGGIGAGGGISVGGATGVGGTSAIAGAAGATGAPLTCGDEVCDTGTQICCAGFGGFGCIGKGSECTGAVLGCTTNGDCGMEVCCISITGDAAAASSCKPSCNVMGSGRDRQLCQVDGDCRPPFRFCTPTVFGVNICTRRP